MSLPAAAIPYERQSDPEAHRLCGAAALSMVYRSFGQTCSQAEIWPRISKRNNLGSLTSATYLMTQDAQSRGLAAIAVRARQPLEVLRRCKEKGLRVILNHRLTEDTPLGHYTVLVDVDQEAVVLHDPYFGPSRRISHDALRELWRPLSGNSEITGDMLIAVSPETPGPAAPCGTCGTAIPLAAPCAVCSKPVALQPAAALGCIAPGCAERTWVSLTCPYCDHAWTLEPSAAAPGAAPDPDEAPLDLERLFGELDKFRDYVLSLPAAAGHPGIRRQFEVIEATKGELIRTQAEELTRRRAHRTKLGDLQKTYAAKEEAVRIETETQAKPGAPLDGSELARALLKDLGLIPGSAEAGRETRQRRK